MIKWIFFIFFFGYFFLFSCDDPEQSSDSNRKVPPNIVFVLADDFGIGDVEVFNPESKIPTPHLNKLAHEGLMLTDAHTSSSVCTPTRYGVLTGRYNWRSPIKSGVLYGRDSALITSQTSSIPALLKKAGYHTSFIGKWHLGWNWVLDNEGDIDFTSPITGGPNGLGFDYAYGHIASLDIPPYVYIENRYATAIPDTMIPATNGYDFYRKGYIAPDFKMEQVTPHFFAKAREYIRDQSQSEDPFYLYLPLPSPHTPILPTSEWQGKSGINPYADFVMEIDHYMGELVGTLDSLGISDETMVVFTTDNGCSPMAKFNVLAEKGHDPSAWFRGHKADIFEGGHRVPTIVKYPKMIKPGTQSDRTICLTDFYATFAALAGIELKEDQGVDSYSILPLMDDATQDQFERKATVHSSINGSFAIRHENWKLNLCPGSGGWSYPRPQKAIEEGLPPVQLYNLASDPGETDNLYAKHPEKVRNMYDMLRDIIDKGRSTQGPDQQNDPNGYGAEWKSLDKLKALDDYIAALNKNREVG